jgi:ribosome-binding protein aMBF1 (putative translation factor)
MTTSKHDEIRFRWKWINDFLTRATDVHKHICEEIVQELMEQRVDAKMSRAQCADLMGISASYLFMIEQGRVVMSDKILDGYLSAMKGVRSNSKTTKRGKKKPG